MQKTVTKQQAEDIEKVFPTQSFRQWLWEYVSLEKKYKNLSKAKQMADKKGKAHNKRFYVFPLSDGRYYVLSRHQIERAKKEGVFKQGMSFYDILVSSVYYSK